MVVKIQKPDVRLEARADLYVLRFLVSLMDDIGVFRRVSLASSVRQLEEWLSDELDLTIEAQNSSALYDHAERHHQADVIIPMIYSDFTKKRVLVREYISGMKADNILSLLATRPEDVRAPLAERSIDLVATSRGLIRDMMRQYFVDGFFHLNPYPSSLILAANGQFSYTDFGIIGHAAYPTAPFLLFWRASQNQDADDAANALVDFAEPATRAPFERLLTEDARSLERFQKTFEILKEKLTADLTPILNAWHGPESQKPARTSASSLLAILGRLRFYRLTLPPDAIAFLRALLMLELIALKLDPSFVLADSIRDFLNNTPIATPLVESTDEHQQDMEPINEFESLHTVDIAPEAMGEAAIRAGETLAAEREKFDAWISVLAERVPELYNDIKYI